MGKLPGELHSEDVLGDHEVCPAFDGAENLIIDIYQASGEHRVGIHGQRVLP